MGICMFKMMTTTPMGTRASTTQFVTNSLSTRLPELSCDPEDECTLDGENFTMDLMLPQTTDKMGPRDAKMADQFNRHNGLRRCHFKLDHVVYENDYSKRHLDSRNLARLLGNVV
ncbi:unnamed protein product [Haemonchus placei]|uniref:CACTA en-spm transposon protein n=1 Tax=Haemonchus placei TaxID=6290 RepID=A0A0N4WET3_HAEPC|nr:unnamed protein product [Haemonchus placei]